MMVARHTTALEALLVEDAFEGEVFCNEPMARHTAYRIGGPVRLFVQVSTFAALSQLVKRCNEDAVPWVVVGKGTNLLVSDEGFEGVVIVLGHGFRTCRFEEERSCFVVGAGIALAAVVQEAFKRALAGLEFAVGTPGTVGGAIRMNAGSDREWIGSQIRTVTTFSASSGLKRYQGSDITWSYRACSIPHDEVVLECEIAVEKVSADYIRGKMEGLLEQRKKSQPYGDPSCGSVFKNPAGSSAGALIEGAGMKGQRIGGAVVSSLHANFIVNDEGAHAVDVKNLIVLVQAKVKEAYGIELQPELTFLGFA